MAQRRTQKPATKKKTTKKKRRSFVSRVGGSGAWYVRTLRWLLFLGVLGTLAGVLVLAALYVLIDIPDPNKDFQTQTTNVYYSDGKTKIGSFANQDRDSIDYDEMPQVIKDAVVAAEDRTFWDNRGIDIKGIIRAARDNATSGRVTGGGSTITQQYVKILYLTQERSYSRKLKEAILSVKIDRQLGKEEILEGYLNTIYFGNGAYGIEVASQTYFDKPAAELNVPQAAFLATIINSPSYYDPYVDGAKDRIMPRYQYVLDGMASSGAITQEQLAKYRDTLPKFAKQRTNNRFAGTKGYILDLVQRQMKLQGFSEENIIGGGYRIVTTIDKSKQKAAVEAVKTVRPEGVPEINTAVVSIQPGTGAVKALYGGRDYLKSQLNWATLGTQPGSTFKAFAVVAALENGYSLKSRLNGNSPLTIGNDEIENQGDSGGRSYGYLSLESATEHSVNTAFADLTDQMEDGPEKILDSAREAGIPQSTLDEISPVLGVSLGYAKVAPIDMANAYATIAAGGERAEWYLIAKVTDSNGATEYEHEVETTRTIEEDVAADTLSALQKVVSVGTGTNARTAVCRVAGKTGTATATDADGNNARVSSSWFIGTSPKLTTAVMYNRGTGNEQLEGYLNPFYGGTYPALTFKAYMDQALDPDNCGTFPAAANIKAEEGTVVRTTPTKKPTPKKTTTPTTNAPTTAPPTTEAPTTAPPTTEAPTTAPPTTEAPTTETTPAAD